MRFVGIETAVFTNAAVGPVSTAGFTRLAFDAAGTPQASYAGAAYVPFLRHTWAEWAANGYAAVSAARYFVAANANPNSTETQSARLVLFAGFRGQMRYWIETALGTDSTTVTIRQNGVNTSVTATIAATVATGSDLANSFAVAAGDRITCQVTKSGTEAITAGVRVDLGGW